MAMDAEDKCMRQAKLQGRESRRMRLKIKGARVPGSRKSPVGMRHEGGRRMLSEFQDAVWLSGCLASSPNVQCEQVKHHKFITEPEIVQTE